MRGHFDVVKYAFEKGDREWYSSFFLEYAIEREYIDVVMFAYAIGAKFTPKMLLGTLLLKTAIIIRHNARKYISRRGTIQLMRNSASIGLKC